MPEDASEADASVWEVPGRSFGRLLAALDGSGAAATCSDGHACGSATFSGTSSATCNGGFAACSRAKFTGFSTANCSADSACYSATFNDSSTASTSLS